MHGFFECIDANQKRGPNIAYTENLYCSLHIFIESTFTDVFAAHVRLRKLRIGNFQIKRYFGNSRVFQRLQQFNGRKDTHQTDGFGFIVSVVL
jgi:hypothetical protein